MISDTAERHPVDQLAEEFVARYRRGERPSIAEYTEKYPELAGELHNILTALVLIEQHAPEREVGESGRGSAEMRRIPDQLGEYRILREIGHGGMGVVYEAVQESLGRHVALKVLPFHAVIEPARLKRFQREAQAAAKLHHTNIVPVFGVGMSGGVHYYAMQFIAGRGLDEVIDELSRLKQNNAPGSPGWAGDGKAAIEKSDTPIGANLSTLSDTPRYYQGVARLGAQVAEALQHAHSQGILHRDIKPANLLLDGQGTVWVTDFGLAKAEGMDELTHTGDLVGTLRYTAPERLRGVGDARADIYSLGVTLYELLVLRPACDAPERAALIRQIAQDDPLPPRKRDPRIPRDLETIVLKAMAKEPAARYATADALAEDLRRFLGDRPIEARRATWWEHSWRWCRRNPAVAGASAVAIAALVIGLAVATWQWRRADANFRQAETVAVQSDQDFRLALESIEQMIGKIEDETQFGSPDAMANYQAVLKEALGFYEKMLKRPRSTQRTSVETAEAHFRVAWILAHLEDSSQAEPHFEQALDLLKQLPHREDEQLRRLRLRGSIHLFRGLLRQRAGRSAEAALDFRQALPLWDRLYSDAAVRTDDVFGLLVTHRELARALRESSQEQEAERLLQKHNEIVARLLKTEPAHALGRQFLAGGQRDLADLHFTNRQFSAAETEYVAAIAAFEDWIKDCPTSAVLSPWQAELGGALHNLAMIQRQRGEKATASDNVKQAIAYQQSALRATPREPHAITFLERHYWLQRTLLAELGEQDSIDQAFTEQLAFLRALKALDAEYKPVSVLLAHTHEALGRWQRDANRLAEAESSYRQAVTILQELLAQDSTDPKLSSELSAALNDLSIVLAKNRRWNEMIPLLEEAIKRQETAIAARPNERLYYKFSHSHHSLLAQAYHGLGDHRKVVPLVATIRQRFPDLSADYYWAVRVASYIPVAENDAALTHDERRDLAARYADQTMDLLRGAASKKHQDLARLSTQREFKSLRARPDFVELLAETRGLVK